MHRVVRQRWSVPLVILVAVGVLPGVVAIWSTPAWVGGAAASAKSRPNAPLARHGPCTVKVSYAFYPQSLEELRHRASAVVVAHVVDVQQQPKDVARGPQHLTQRVIVDVLRTIEGAAPAQLTLWHFGTNTVCALGAPPFRPGERYVLFVMPLEDEPGVFHIPAPPARYRVIDDRLEPMGEDNIAYAEALRGKTIAALERVLAEPGSQPKTAQP